jgi:ABC-type sugar transport system ATPase subunit
MTPAVLEARDVTKAYRRHQVLRGVSLAVAPEQVVPVVGENGAGKSTLLKILAGTLAPAFRQFPVAWRFALRNQAAAGSPGCC